MKRLLWVLTLVFTTSLLSAQELSREEKTRASDYLKETRDAFLGAVDGLSPAQLNFKPAPDRWSVAEVAEHITASEDMLRDLVTDQVLKAPPRSEPADVKEIDDFVLKAIPDRTHKVKAPEPLIPSKRFGGFEETIQHFNSGRAKTLELLESTDDLRAHAIDSPLGKKLDGYQWLLFLAAHSERHTRQIEEVKADPNFPKS